MAENRGAGTMPKQYLLASDFDQTLSFNDSGHVLSELLGASGFAEKVAGLSRVNLVQQGGELAYLILHDPEYRRVRREHLCEVGRRVRLKQNIPLLVRFILHVNRRDGFTIAVSDARAIAPLARRTVLSDDALSVLVPILEDILGWGPARIRALFESEGLLIHEWDKVRTDRVTIREPGQTTA